MNVFVLVRDSLLSRAPPYPPRVGHVILKTMCSSQFVCAKRLRKFGCFDRFTFVYLPSILDMRPEDAQKICKSSFVRTFVLFSFVIRFPLVQVASFAFCNFQLYRLRLRRLCRRACDRLNIFQCPKFVLWLYSTVLVVILVGNNFQELYVGVKQRALERFLISLCFSQKRSEKKLILLLSGDHVRVSVYY